MFIDQAAIQRKVQNAAKGLSGDVSLQRLFRDEFIRKCSKFYSAKELFESAGVFSQAGFERWIESEADAFISENTSYHNWDAFLNEAARGFVKEKIALLRKGQWVEEKFGNPYEFESIHIYLNFSVK